MTWEIPWHLCLLNYTVQRWMCICYLKLNTTIAIYLKKKKEKEKMLFQFFLVCFSDFTLEN